MHATFRYGMLRPMGVHGHVYYSRTAVSQPVGGLERVPSLVVAHRWSSPSAPGSIITGTEGVTVAVVVPAGSPQ